MGWEIRHVGPDITLHLDEHGGEKERQDEALAAEFTRALYDALRPVLFDERFRGILLYEPEWFFPDEEPG